MPIYALSDDLILFPPSDLAEKDGLLAVGGDLSSERLLLAYKSGIFPWYSDYDPILWWAPNPRFVLFPNKVKVSKSMRQVLRKKMFRVTFDQAFEDVITSCQLNPRKQQEGTWITVEMRDAYIRLHRLGWAHSVEVWDENDKLVGGLYGVAINSYYSGESMFTKVSNASKVGFIYLVRHLQKWGFQLIDCQIYTQHLKSLGAEEVQRSLFMEELNKSLEIPSQKTGKWTVEEEILR